MGFAVNQSRNGRRSALRAIANLFQRISELNSTRMAVFHRPKVELEARFARLSCNRSCLMGEEFGVTPHEATTYWNAPHMMGLTDRNLADFVVSTSNRGDLALTFR